MNWWMALVVIAGVGCSKQSTDCRQASATCADGFACLEASGEWACTPVDVTATAATPAPPPAAATPPPAAPKGFSDAKKKQLTGEATMNIRKMFDSSVSYYTSEFAARSGEILPRQFPDSSGLTPSRKPACRDGRPVPYAANGRRWSAPTWQNLNFSIDREHYYQYEFISTGRGTASMFTARAIGDLDCDGVFSTFERVGVVDRYNNVNGGAGLYINQELE